MSTNSDHPRIEYAYSYQDTPTGASSDSMVIKLRCPGVLSFKWCLKLYSMVMGGLGLLLSFIWVCFHLYVLSKTSLQELRQLRWEILSGFPPFGQLFWVKHEKQNSPLQVLEWRAPGTGKSDSTRFHYWFSIFMNEVKYISWMFIWSFLSDLQLSS